MPNKDIITAAQNLVEIYNIDIDEKLGNKLIQFKNFYNVYQNGKVENISLERWMYKLILEKSLKYCFLMSMSPLDMPFTHDYKQQWRNVFFKIKIDQK